MRIPQSTDVCLKRKRYMLFIAVLVAIVAVGCDYRGPNERALDAEKARVINDPSIPQSEKALAEAMAEGFRPMAREADRLAREYPETYKYVQELPMPDLDDPRLPFSGSSGGANARYKGKINARNTGTSVSQSSTVSRLIMGFEWRQLTPFECDEMGLAQGVGVLVGSVAQGSPASTAGLKKNQVIRAADGVPLTVNYTVEDAKALKTEGQVIHLQIWVGGDKWTDVPVGLVRR